MFTKQRLTKITEKQFKLIRSLIEKEHTDKNLHYAFVIKGLYNGDVDHKQNTKLPTIL